MQYLSVIMCLCGFCGASSSSRLEIALTPIAIGMDMGEALGEWINGQRYKFKKPLSSGEVFELVNARFISELIDKLLYETQLIYPSSDTKNQIWSPTLKAILSKVELKGNGLLRYLIRDPKAFVRGEWTYDSNKIEKQQIIGALVEKMDKILAMFESTESLKVAIGLDEVTESDLNHVLDYVNHVLINETMNALTRLIGGVKFTLAPTGLEGVKREFIKNMCNVVLTILGKANRSNINEQVKGYYDKLITAATRGDQVVYSIWFADNDRAKAKRDAIITAILANPAGVQEIRYILSSPEVFKAIAESAVTAKTIAADQSPAADPAAAPLLNQL